MHTAQDLDVVILASSLLRIRRNGEKVTVVFGYW